MYKLITGAALVLSAAAVSAQMFQHAHGTPQTDMLLDVCRAPGAGYFISGFTTGATFSGQTGLLIRTDLQGSAVWSKAVGGNGMDNVNRVLPSPLGGFFIGGASSTRVSNGMPNAFVGQLADNGDPVWFKSIGTAGEEQLRDMTFAENGDLLITGLSRFFDSSYDMFAARITQGGELVWSAIYGSPEYEVPMSIVEAPDGSIFVWGHQNGSMTQGYDAVLLKLNAQGSPIWSKRYGLSANEIVWDMIVTPDGDLLMSGDTNSEGAGMNDVFLIRANTDGEIIWSNTYGGPSNEHGTRVRHVKNQLFVVTGATASFGAGGLDFMTMFIDQGGGIKYARAYGGDIKDVAHGVTISDDHGIFLVGETRSFGPGLMNGLAVRTDQDGDCACNDDLFTGFQVHAQSFSQSTADIVQRSTNIQLANNPNISVIEFTPQSSAICEQLTQEGSSWNNPITSEAHSIQLPSVALSERFSLYPNPSNGLPVRATVLIDEPTPTLIEVFNIEGKRIAEIQVAGNGKVETLLPQLSGGIYLIRSTSGGKSETRRLIIN